MTRRWSLILLTLFLIVLVVSACGKKAPPFIPKEVFLAKVVGLKGQWVNENVYLTGTIDQVETQKGIHQGIKGCRVYYVEFPVENPPCTGCPIQYNNFHEFGADVITSKGLACNIPVDGKDKILFLKAHLIGPGDVVGPASDQIRVDVE